MLYIYIYYIYMYVANSTSDKMWCNLQGMYAYLYTYTNNYEQVVLYILVKCSILNEYFTFRKVIYPIATLLKSLLEDYLCHDFLQLDLLVTRYRHTTQQ